ncbi:MAG: DUF86 domain-containing protein [Nitrospinae bacterium]|nr:DUF86 domain-containing protein [Nitrospinota bacterium]
MPISPLEYLRHILDETKYIIPHAKKLDKHLFKKDETLKRAFVRCLEIIGEATKKVPSDFKSKYPNIEWKEMAGMRDLLIHNYFGIDYDIVWDVVANKIPELQEKIEEIFGNESKGAK